MSPDLLKCLNFIKESFMEGPHEEKAKAALSEPHDPHVPCIEVVRDVVQQISDYPSKWSSLDNIEELFRELVRDILSLETESNFDEEFVLPIAEKSLKVYKDEQQHVH